jgi:hypothetical protein
VAETNDESDVHLPRRLKKSSYQNFVPPWFLYRVFGHFVTRRVKKSKKRIWAHKRKCVFFPPFFFFNFGGSPCQKLLAGKVEIFFSLSSFPIDFVFISFLAVSLGAQKHHKNIF